MPLVKATQSDLADNLQNTTFAMMKIAKISAIAVALLALSLTAGAQGHVQKAMQAAKDQREAMNRAKAAREQSEQPRQGEWLRMKVENGDTTYYDNLRPIWITSRRKGTTEKQWRDYYKLVYRFARVYPYAEAAGPIVQEADSVIKARKMNSVQKDRYIKDIQKQLFKSGAIAALASNQ